MSAFDGAGLNGRDQGVYLTRARPRGDEKGDRASFGIRGRLAVHRDQR
ncbi:hypothetical protein [Streptomyces viridochromogenes]|nr:hypothetical protein [Streptomyces viridochromogenes]